MATPAIASGLAGHKVLNAGESVEIVAVDSSPIDISKVPALPADMKAHEVVQRYIESFRQPEKDALVERLGATKPRDVRDLQALLNLYDREDPYPRQQIERSLRLLSPADIALAPFFRALIKDPDPKFQLFGMAGAYNLRDTAVLQDMEELGSKRFEKPRPSLAMNPPDAAAWHTRFECIRLLAAWDSERPSGAPPEHLSLLIKQSRQAPPVARLLAQYYWPLALRDILEWSESKDLLDQERARFAWEADVPRLSLRETSGTLRAVLFDRRKRMETRHRAALRLGLAADGAEVERLLADHAKEKDEKTLLLVKTALFASRDTRVAPVLRDYAKADPVASNRAGALVQLGEMLPRAEFRALLEEVAKDDKDAENRAWARQELSR
jgi:hypothetical protein